MISEFCFEPFANACIRLQLMIENKDVSDFQNGFLNPKTRDNINMSHCDFWYKTLEGRDIKADLKLVVDNHFTVTRHASGSQGYDGTHIVTFKNHNGIWRIVGCKWTYII